MLGQKVNGELLVNEWKLPEDYVFDGRTVRYGVSGCGPPVVLVHGTLWSSFNLRHFIEAISRDFTVYYYDLIGYGQSDKSPGDVSLGIQNQVLDHLLDHWGLENPAIVGHDFGGTTVLRTHLISGRDTRYDRSSVDRARPKSSFLPANCTGEKQRGRLETLWTRN
jgi:pimeloyl-ACP methyl ester carboxylesterase